MLSAVAVLAIALGIAWYVRGQQDGLNLDFRISLSKGAGIDIGFLCEWHYPATNGTPKTVEVCYSEGSAVQCYRLVGNCVTSYHFDQSCRFWREMEKVRTPAEDRELLTGHNDYSPESWEPCLSFEERWRTRAAWDFNEQVCPFEEKGAGYVAVMAWKWVPLGPPLPGALPKSRLNPDSSAVAVWPMGEAPPAVNALHDAVKAFITDPSTRYDEFQPASYIRGYPVRSPERPDRIHVLKGWRQPRDFHWNQRDVLRFLPCMNRELMPIAEGINPFKGFGTPYAPGNSVTLNYRSKEKDFRWYLKGDNFWHIKIYGGTVNSNEWIEASGQKKGIKSR